jgi:hypothetical protein
LCSVSDIKLLSETLNNFLILASGLFVGTCDLDP